MGLVGELVRLAEDSVDNIRPGSVQSWLDIFISFANSKRATQFGTMKLPQNKVGNFGLTAGILCQFAD